MVVDDTAGCRRPLARLLKRAGYAAVCAGDGREALDALDAVAPDLILLALHMPVMDGFAFLAAVRADRRWASLPVVVFSGEAGGSLARAKELGATEALAKGGAVRELLACIHQHLSPA